MGDCEDTDFFWESWTLPAKRKRKKDAGKDKKCKNNVVMTTAGCIQKKKKKKKDKFKVAMEEKKKKKKKKSRSASQATSVQAKPAVKPEAPSPRGADKPNPDHLTQDSKKKAKRKKKVAFELPPGCIRVKRPKFASLSSPPPKEGALSEKEARRDSEGCLQAAVTGRDQGPARDSDSQCNSQDINSQDINSQDLFITQKKFKASPSKPCSDEASDRAFTLTPEMFTQHLEGRPQDSHVHQRHRETNEQEGKTKTVQVEEEEEVNGLNEAHCNPKKGKLSLQTQMELNFTEEKKTPVKPSVVNTYLAEPIVVDASPEVVKSKRYSRTSLRRSTTSTSTQTENLFTTELSLYLSFCRRGGATTRSGDSKPLDLSLPHRARKDLRACLSANASSERKGDKGETSPSPQSESEPKSADTTTSSEDNEAPCRAGRLDLTQVRAVQMRLNESFFFKSKGEGQSPRPESPLMKLTQGRNVKSRKGH